MRLYQHPTCSTCSKARAWLEQRDIEPELFDIREQPPSVEELRKLLEASGEVRKLFNSSGMQYRELGLKEKLPDMSDEEALELLAENGMLIRRPVLLGDGIALCGFREKAWGEALG